MSFDITNLGPAIGNVNSRKYAVQAITDTPFYKLMLASGNVTYGLKGKDAIQKLTNNINLQDASTCGARNPIDGVLLDQVYIETKQIADLTNLCSAQLHNTFFGESLKQGQSPNEEFIPEFTNFLMADRATRLGTAIESLLFKGDTSLSSGNNKRIDGYLKRLTGATYVTSGNSATTITATGVDMVAKLQAVFTASTADVRHSDDYVIFVSQYVWDEYNLSLANRNLYKDATDSRVFGTSAKLFMTPGLNPDSNTDGRTVIAGRLSDMQMAMDGQSDADQATIKTSTENNFTYLDFKFALGAAIVYSKQFIVAKV